MKKIVLFVIFMASTAFGQNAADVVVSNSVNAHGGASRISALRTIVVSGQITERGLTEPLAITASLDGYVRWDYGTTPRSIITTPKHRFEIFDGRASYRPPHVGAFAQFDVLAPVNLARLADAGTQRTLQSTAIVQSRFANVVQIDMLRSVTSSGMTIRDRPILYVDTVTNLIS